MDDDSLRGKNVFESVQQAIRERRERVSKSYHDIPLCAFVSWPDHDAIHKLRPEEQVGWRDDGSPIYIGGDGTMWCDYLPENVSVEPDPRVPTGHPRVLPESIDDFVPEERWQVFLTTSHAEQLVLEHLDVHVRIDDANEPSDPNFKTVLVEASAVFEQLGWEVWHDQERIENEEIQLTTTGTSHSKDYTGRDPLPVETVSVKVRSTHHRTESIDTGRVREPRIGVRELQQLAQAIQARVGSVEVLPITGRKRVWRGFGDQPTVAEWSPKIDAQADEQFEERTVQCGERRFWRGRVFVGNPAGVDWKKRRGVR